MMKTFLERRSKHVANVNVAWWVECVDFVSKMWEWKCIEHAWSFGFFNTYRYDQSETNKWVSKRKWWEPVYVTPCLQHNQELLMDVLSFASTEDATRAEAACFQQIGAA